MPGRGPPQDFQRQGNAVQCGYGLPYSRHRLHSMQDLGGRQHAESAHPHPGKAQAVRARSEAGMGHSGDGFEARARGGGGDDGGRPRSHPPIAGIPRVNSGYDNELWSEGVAVGEPKTTGTGPGTEKTAGQKPLANEYPFSVTVGDVYDGPLDLLLDLIRKQDVDIYDIPIAQITAQYLSYIEKLKQLDVNLAADFVYMASLLIQIKSRMLLPRDPSAPAGTEEDPRDELVNRLLEHERFKTAAQLLMQKHKNFEAVMTEQAAVRDDWR